ncbi:hypothetical protein OZN62_13105 [Aurantiacibacter sp. MUD11]|uniref:hypothetical protein n=1 Tax=Aurantiacibacter sp. MUD11 TaxID=3003265 RepID=UPI0022AB3424|nr:hypothetical protein [Aurantiacibacter sp. MUD11]WAT17835.1 hypothetical protein OZN62_13105 [Aurantiacibacter sp. MUD11]
MRQPLRPLFVLTMVPLAACAAPRDEYPSLAVRDIERVTGTMEVEPAPPPPPPAPAPATIEQLQQLAADARSAHAEFLEAAPAARSTVVAAAGAEHGSDGWARAQVAIADLEARRSRTTIAMADIDRIFVSAMSDSVHIEEIEATHAEIGSLLAEQDAVVDSLLELLTS